MEQSTRRVPPPPPPRPNPQPHQPEPPTEQQIVQPEQEQKPQNQPKPQRKEKKKFVCTPKMRFGWLIAGGVFAFSAALACLVLVFVL